MATWKMEPIEIKYGTDDYTGNDLGSSIFRSEIQSTADVFSLIENKNGEEKYLLMLDPWQAKRLVNALNKFVNNYCGVPEQ